MQKSALNGTDYLVGATTDNSGGVSSLVDQSKYFLPLENTKPPRSLVDVTQLVFPESVIVAIACGKSEQSRNRSFLILECVEQEHYAIRRIDLVNSVPMKMFSALSGASGVLKAGVANEEDKLFVEMQCIQDEYTIYCLAISAAEGAVLRSEIEQENLRRLSTSPTSPRTGLRMFSARPATREFIASLSEYFESIGVNIFPNNLIQTIAGPSVSQ